MAADRVTRSQSKTVEGTDRAVVRRAALVHVLACHAPSRVGYKLWLTGVGAWTLGAGRHAEIRVDGSAHARRGVLTIDDPWVSGEHAYLRSSFGGYLLEDAGSKNGTLVAGTRVRRHRLHDGDRIEIGRSHFFYREYSVTTDVGAEPAIAEPVRFGIMATHIPAWAAELGALERVARSDLSVLLLGEPGSGKEVLASAVHTASARRGSLVAVNCAAMPVTLVESLLFGHRRGAYSGALEDARGLVRSADRGTLLLDEVGDLPPQAQGVLLRVLQDRLVRGLGETADTRVDVRFISATNRDLKALAATDRFRADLLARLAAHTTVVPPLRDRRDDLGLVIASVLDGANATAAQLTPAAARALLDAAWPGNARDLSATLQRAVVLAGPETIGIPHLPPELVPEQADDHKQPAMRGLSAPEPSPSVAIAPQDEALYRDLVGALGDAHGNLSEVARRLGKHRRQIHRWLRRFGLRPEQFQ